jgi:hypothetical protein
MAKKTASHEITLDGKTRILYNPKTNKYRVFCNDKDLHDRNGLQLSIPIGWLGDRNVRECMTALDCEDIPAWVPASPSALKKAGKSDSKKKSKKNK